MPCQHKFADYLNLQTLTFEPTTLIIGTFNPGWDNIGNTAEWFYGRTARNYFWDVLPRIYEQENLRNATSHEWKAFCQRNRIAITDFLACVNDADSDNPAHVNAVRNYQDAAIANEFNDYAFVDVVNILNDHPTIQNVYWTRQLGIEFWDLRWNTVTAYCEVHDIRNRTLLTPSGSARFQMQGLQRVQLRDFIYQRWIDEWHFQPAPNL